MVNPNKDKPDFYNDLDMIVDALWDLLLIGKNNAEYPNAVGGKGSDKGVFAEGTHFGILFPGQSGEIYPAHLILVGNFTTNGVIPILDGTIPSTDTNTTLTGLNLELDSVNTSDSGCQISIGPENGNNYNKFVVGTHSAYIDATFITEDWSQWDVVSVGFRIVESFNASHNNIIGNGAGDPLYTDFATFGLQEQSKIQITTSLNGTTTYTNTTNTPNNGKNLRLRVNLSKTGDITYQFVNDAIAGEGTLVTPNTIAAFKFDNGDNVIPYIITNSHGTSNRKLLLKDIKINRSGVPHLTNFKYMNDNFCIEGNNVTNTSVSYTLDRVGIVLTTGTALGDSVILKPSTSIGQSPWNNILLNPVGPSVDIFERDTWETWDNVFNLIAKDTLKQIKNWSS